LSVILETVHDPSTGSKPIKATITNVIMHIYRHENGVFGLYRGIMPTLMVSHSLYDFVTLSRYFLYQGVAPYVALNFTCYETLRALVTPEPTPDNPRPQPTVPWKLFCGGTAGAIAQTLTYPLDLIRRRFQVMGMRSPVGKTNAAAKAAGVGGDYGFRYTSTWDAMRTV
jgi:solute carrier family 25 phosphate transporter 23/24/25/41